MIKESKYIIRRVIVGVLIAFILSFIGSCEVNAETYPLENSNTNFVFNPTNNFNGVNWNMNYWNGSPNTSFQGIEVTVQLANSLDIIYDGRYLISFLVWSNQYNPSNLTCENLTSNFKNVNMTTGNWVQNEIHSSCYDVYHTSYMGKSAWRLLYEFTYKNKTGSGGINELQFIINSNINFFNGNSYGLDSGLLVSDVLDYDLNVINTWNTDKSQQSIINGQQDIINNQNQNTQDIINNQNQNQAQSHQDSINEQNAINQNTQAQNETNDILEDSSIPSDTDSKINQILSNTQTQNANISELVNFIPNTLQVIINGFNNSCSGGYSLGSLFGTELTIPCINPVDYLGNFLWGVIDSILCLCYLIPLCKFLINKYNDLTSLKNLRWQ